MIEPASGVLLISDPFLKDPNFMRTVVFLCEHQLEGTFGFVLNRKYENTLDELIPELEGHRLPLYYGGPVQMDTVHFLHQYPDEIPGGREVMPDIYWGGEFNNVLEMITAGTLDENKIREKIQWEASDSGVAGRKSFSATMLSIWDSQDKTTMRIDLWVKDMPVDDMKRFFYESFMSMADTYQRATQDAAGTQEIRKFSESFAQKTALF